MVKRHIFKWKQKEFSQIKEFIERNDVLAVADLNMFPANLFQNLRKKLAGKAEIKVSKLRLIQKALNESSKDLNKLTEHVNGSVALIGTQMNPFELYSFVKKNKGNTSAKPGVLAPTDIIIPAGDTGLPPGPALSDLKGAGLKVKITGPTISIVEDKLIVKKGEQINEKVCSVLSKLDIKPVQVMLNIKAVLEKNELFLPEVLDIDTEKIFNDFVTGRQQAFNLAFNIAYPLTENIELLIQKAFRESKALSVEAGILNKLTAGTLVAKAVNQAKALEALVPKASTKGKQEIQKEEVKEKTEEKKETGQQESKTETKTTVTNEKKP